MRDYSPQDERPVGGVRPDLCLRHRLTHGAFGRHIEVMATVVRFPTSGLTPTDIRALEEFCVGRRLRGVSSHLSIGELPPERPEEAILRYAIIKDAPDGKALFVLDRTESVYRVRYWHSTQRQMMMLEKSRHLDIVLKAISEWPAVPFRVPQRTK